MFIDKYNGYYLLFDALFVVLSIMGMMKKEYARLVIVVLSL
jgi:hypothetical protein